MTRDRTRDLTTGFKSDSFGRVRNPQRAIGFDGPRSLITFNDRLSEQVRPDLILDEVEVGHFKNLLFIGEIADAENALLSIPALAPEAEETLPQLKRELGGVWVKGRLRRADLDSANQLSVDLSLR